MKNGLAWEYCVLHYSYSRRVKCKFYEGEFTVGVYHLKHHLAETRNNAKSSLVVPYDIKSTMLDKVYKLQKKLLQKS